MRRAMSKLRVPIIGGLGSISTEQHDNERETVVVQSGGEKSGHTRIKRRMGSDDTSTSLVGLGLATVTVVTVTGRGTSSMAVIAAA